MRIAKLFRTPIAFLVGIMAAASCATAAGLLTICTQDEPSMSAVFPTNGELRVKYVFVSFGTDYLLTKEQHGAVADIVSWYIERQSHGRVKLSGDSGIIFRPGEGFGPSDNPPYAWRAEGSPWFYRSMHETDSSHVNYVNTWSPRTGSWWYGASPSDPIGTDSYATHLNAEILWKIRDAYPTNNPFDVPAGQVVDAVVMIYLSDFTPHVYGTDGRPAVYLNAGAVRSETDYFDSLSFDALGFSGTSQIEYTCGGASPSDPVLRGIASAYSTLHEIFHNFHYSASTTYDLTDGPPNLWSLVGHPEWHYYYGYLNLMCQQTVGLQGVPGLGLPWYAKMQSRDWVQVQDFTGQNLKKQCIYDIRAYDTEDPTAPRGKIFQFSRTSGGTDERFYVAFHGGTGIDAQDFDGDEIPMIRSRGLEIYHCVGNYMYDIESAFGNYSNISAQALPADVETRDPDTFLPTWGTPDAVAGRDNYDYWTSNGLARSDFTTHQGYVFDFFSKDLGEYSQWEKEEFSFRSNPNGFWYESYSVPSTTPLTPPVMMRVNPQTVANSMVIRIREQHNDAPVPYAIVDFLSAPYEDLLAPGAAPSEQYVYGQPMSINWDNYYGEGITQVDILFSPQDGAEGTYESIGQVNTATDGHSFEWTPYQITSTGKIKLIFHNAIESSKTCDEESEYSFAIGAPPENVTVPNGGESLVAGTPTTVNWTHVSVLGQPHGIINTVDIHFFPGAELSAREIALGVDATTTGYEWTPGIDDLTHDGRIRLTFHNAMSDEVGVDESDAAFAVVADVAKYADVSSGSGLDYAGTPYSCVALNYDGDAWGDLLVMSTDDVARLFHGRAPSATDAPRFAATELPGAPTGCRGAAVADYDNDGDEDIFLTHATTPKLYRNNGDGSFTDVTASLGLATLADKSVAACWGDFDRDGRVDLYVVRCSSTGVPTCAGVGGEQHRLFRNATGESGGFVDVTSAAGLDLVANIAALSASWMDIDRDGDLDLFVPAANIPSVGVTPHSLLLMNDGTGHFMDEITRFSQSIVSCPAAEWADVDNDGDQDLVVANDLGSPLLYRNDGTGHFLATPETIDAPEGHSGLKVFDEDMDGWMDLLLVPRDDQHSCRLFSNRRGLTGSTFVERTADAGLTDVGSVGGVVAADFNGDGDADLYLGRPSTLSGRFLYRSGSQSGGASVGHNYVKLVLNSLEQANNAQGIGAVVKVTAGTLVQTRIPDGGSGRGGQGDRVLVFGIGDYDGPVSAKVTWPGGRVKENIALDFSNVQRGESINVITDDTTPTVSNVVATKVFDPATGNLIWEFSWATDVSSNPAMDAFVIDQAGIAIPCLPQLGTITVDSGFAHVYQVKATGGYTHKFLGVSEECIPNCRFRCSATSAVGTRSDTSPQQGNSVKVCPSQQ